MNIVFMILSTKKMEDKFKPLECNDHDVLSFHDNLVKFAKFKENFNQEFHAKVNNLLKIEEYQRFSTMTKILNLIHTSFGECDISMNFSSPKEEKECEILRLGSKNWQKGKLRTQAVITFVADATAKAQINFSLEFCPDEPEITQPESPLDDIRRMINSVTS
ncbi:MAG: KGK domain-containing protein [Heteroscytonema crispum UTEX LB 1556]